MNFTVANHAASGAILIGSWAIGLFFFRFQRRSGDRFFGRFGVGFWLLAVERVLLLATDPENEQRFFVYLVRLIAFLFILYAIVEKNRESSPMKNPNESPAKNAKQP